MILDVRLTILVTSQGRKTICDRMTAAVAMPQFQPLLLLIILSIF